jgi:hypothetical protein
LKTKCRFLVQNNASAQRSVLVKDFLTKKNVTTLEIPQYSSDLSAGDMCLLSGLESTLKGRRFCNANDIIKNATVQLKRLSKCGFQEYFQHLSSCWKKCVFAQVEYFEGNIA